MVGAPQLVWVVALFLFVVAIPVAQLVAMTLTWTNPEVFVRLQVNVRLALR